MWLHCTTRRFEISQVKAVSVPRTGFNYHLDLGRGFCITDVSGFYTVTWDSSY